MKTLRELRRYPSAVLGLSIIGIFIIISIVTVITIPYEEGIRLWRGGPGVWDYNARRAAPVWFDWFTRDRLPRTMVIYLDDATMTKELIGDGMEQVEITFDFEYPYDGFPKEFTLFFNGNLTAGQANLSFRWWRPDGQVITVAQNRTIRAIQGRYPISQDVDLRDRLGTPPHMGLFAEDLDANTSEMKPLKGDYRMVIEGEMPVGEGFHQIEMVIYGQVEGWGGTDHLRRDLIVGLLWGAPIGLIFGVLAAIGAQVSTFVLAGIGTWFGGKVDFSFRRLTELNMILPFLAILIMIAHLYSPSIWVILGIVIALNVFSASYLTYRAMFLQAKELPYIEAAQAYGAGSFRIVFTYLLPRALPILLPQFVMIIPTFVFLEATLAVLGLGDPQLATWGKMINDAQANSAMYMGQYYWMVLPSILLMTVGLGFALLGFSLDRVFNPRLREL